MVFRFAHADVLVSLDQVYQFLNLVPIEDQFVVAYPHYQLIDFVNFDEVYLLCNFSESLVDKKEVQ